MPRFPPLLSFIRSAHSHDGPAYMYVLGSNTKHFCIHLPFIWEWLESGSKKMSINQCTNNTEECQILISQVNIFTKTHNESKAK